MLKETVEIEAEKAKVKLVVNQFVQFWETADTELLSRIFAHDADMVNYGTDTSEYFVGWEALKGALEQMLPMLKNVEINVKDQVIKIHQSGQVAWFSQVWDWESAGWWAGYPKSWSAIYRGIGKTKRPLGICAIS